MGKVKIVLHGLLHEVLQVSIPYGKGKVMGPEEEDPTTTKYQFPMGKVKILKRWELS